MVVKHDFSGHRQFKKRRSRYNISVATVYLDIRSHACTLKWLKLSISCAHVLSSPRIWWSREINAIWSNWIIHAQLFSGELRIINKVGFQGHAKCGYHLETICLIAGVIRVRLPFKMKCWRISGWWLGGFSDYLLGCPLLFY